jgi:nucleotide-binding universal stress UspA family protein
VAGGFGHSRAQEFVFGGATRTFLNTPSSPALLLAH